MVLSVLRVAIAASADPVAPDGDEARRWAEQELAKPVYAVSEPTFFDRAARAVGEFLTALLNPRVGDGFGLALAVGAVVIVVVVVVVAFLVWGRPRAVHRSRAASAELFGETEGRTAAQLRRDATAAAAREEWDAAIVLRFRALARGLDERGLVDLEPGATVHRFARLAGRVFPAATPALDAAASAFDDVRYLRRPGTAELYQRVVAADEAVAAAAPRLTPQGALA
ncbi:DUF4129 domain-containing protein [Microbacterium sp. CJ88]|uniref:DUF4129 domain-containing protein n=1 Tax=Microbacterium sp. CJ88 TaxID=3445672 RepID=UPI003F659EC6